VRGIWDLKSLSDARGMYGRFFRVVGVGCKCVKRMWALIITGRFNWVSIIYDGFSEDVALPCGSFFHF
jgi:hypothetical protein